MAGFLRTMRVVWPILLTAALFCLPIFTLLLPAVERSMWERKHEVLQQSTRVALSLVERIDRETTDRSAAQRQAKKALRGLRYGPEGKDYFWIHDLDTRLLMHPYRPDLLGRPLDTFVNPGGRPIFAEMTAKAREEGSAWLHYMWQWKDNPNRTSPKISYIQIYRPWGWLIGTGLYTDDVSAEIAHLTRRIEAICLGILGLLSILATVLAGRGVRADNRRQRAEQELRQHRDVLETQVEERTAELRRQQESLEAQVADRTRDLRSINELLCKEINQRETVTLALEESEVRLASILQKLPTGLAVIDAETRRITDVNPALLDMLELQREDLVGRTCRHHICPDGRDTCPVIDLGEEVVQRQRRVVKSTGAEVPVLTTAIPLTLDGRPHLLENFIDMTTMAETPARSTTPNIAAGSGGRTWSRTALLATMSREFHAHMTTILGFTEVLIGSRDNPEEQRRAAQAIRRTGEILVEMVDDIRDLSKIEVDDLPLEDLPVRLPGLIQSAWRQIQQRLEAKALTGWACVAAGERIPRVVHTDPIRLRQILVNLLGAAVRFTEVGGVTLTVAFEPTRERLTLQVTDTGPGLSTEERERLLHPFARPDTPPTAPLAPTALSLALSRRVAELMGGGLDIQANKNGGGTTYTVTLCTPMTAAEGWETSLEGSRPEPAPQPTAAPPEKPAGQLAGRRILLAEDGPDNQRLITHFLTREGAELAVAENGILAVERAREAEAEGHPFNLVLMDIQMPEMDGYQATRTLRALGYDRPIIALTANDQDVTRERCLEAGCDEFATKPVNRKDLIRTVLAFMSRD